MINKGMFSSNTDNWSTPQDFFDELDREFNFNLDPCADETNHKTPDYFTKDQDGLLQDWSGRRVFCNPPYGREIGKWVEKAYVDIPVYTDRHKVDRGRKERIKPL